MSVLAALAVAATLPEHAFEACHLDLRQLQPPIPRFETYPAAPEPESRPAKVRLSTAEARLFRTQLRSQSALTSDFAGHYRLAIWGCGSGCLQFAAIDRRSGQVRFPPDFHTVEQISASPLERLTYRKDSRLLVVTGLLDEDEKRLGVHFYRIDRAGFRLMTTYRYDELCAVPRPPN